MKYSFYMQNQKIYHLAENVSFESGGVRTVLTNLDNFLNANETGSSTIITNKKEVGDLYLEYPPKKNMPWNYCPELKEYLKTLGTDNSVFHLHGVFMYTQYIGSRIALEKQIPYVISPHGMLEPWHLKDKSFKKRIYLELFLKNILSKSKILHAITPLEKENLFALTKHKYIYEIPNFIHFSDIPNDLTYSPDEEEYMLFLGRLHPKKGLDILIESMTKIENKKIQLKIVGSENEYSTALKVKCKELGIDHRVAFLGGVFNTEKNKLFANAKVFIAPSYSEAIGMVNLEAAACKTPVITTYNTGINPAWNQNGGIMIQPTAEELTKSINTALSWNDIERNERGRNLAQYVLNHYSWETNGKSWVELYNAVR